MAKKRKPKAILGTNETAKEPSLAAEIGRIAKIFALYALKDIPEERKKVSALYAFGYSGREIAELLGKTEVAVRKAKERSRG